MKTLVVHPNKAEAKKIRDLLDAQATTEATSEDAAFEALRKPAHGLELLVVSPGEMGQGVIERLSRTDVPVLVVTADDEPPYPIMAVCANVAGYIHRGDLDAKQLKDACDKAVATHKRRKERTDEVPGNDAAFAAYSI